MDRATTELTAGERHDLWLHSVRPDSEEISQPADGWATLAGGERTSRSHNWDHDMAAVENLVRAAHQGEPGAEHRRELGTLVRQLRDPAAIGRCGRGIPAALRCGVMSNAGPARQIDEGGDDMIGDGQQPRRGRRGGVSSPPLSRPAPPSLLARTGASIEGRYRMSRVERATGARGVPPGQRQGCREGRVGKGKATDGNRWPSCGLAGSPQPFSTGLGIVVSGSPNRASSFDSSIADNDASVKGDDAARVEDVPVGPGASPNTAPDTGDTAVERDAVAGCLALSTLRIGPAGFGEPDVRRCVAPRGVTGDWWSQCPRARSSPASYLAARIEV